MSSSQWLSSVAVYKGDSLLCVGTVKECSKALGFSEQTIKNWVKPSHHRRAKGQEDQYHLAYRIEEEEEE